MSVKSEIVFRSAFSLGEVLSSSAGSLFRPQYRDKVEKNGSITIEETTPFDLDGMIQSSKDECLIYNILERAVSDPDVLKKMSGNFVDVRSDQISFADHLQRVIDLQQRFDNLPFSIRKMFDNNLHSFVEALRDGSADNVVKDYIKANSDQFIKQVDVPVVEGGKTE